MLDVVDPRVFERDCTGDVPHHRQAPLRGGIRDRAQHVSLQVAVDLDAVNLVGRETGNGRFRLGGIGQNDGRLPERRLTVDDRTTAEDSGPGYHAGRDPRAMQVEGGAGARVAGVANAGHAMPQIEQRQVVRQSAQGQRLVDMHVDQPR